MMLYLKFFPISALTAINKRLCLIWLQIELPQELNYCLLFVYIVKAKIVFIWWGTNTCVCRFACVDRRVSKICKKRFEISMCVCVSVWHATQTYFGLNKFSMCALVDSWFSVEQPCRARRASRHKHIQIVQQKETHKRSSSGQLPQSGSDVNERTCTTGPGSQASRWVQIQLHREGVIDVGDMTWCVSTWCEKGDDVPNRLLKSTVLW